MIPFPTEKHRNDRENFKELKKSGENEEGKSKTALPRLIKENFVVFLRGEGGAILNGKKIVFLSTGFPTNQKF